MAQTTGDLFQIAYCTSLNLGWTELHLGNYERAYTCYATGRQLFKELGIAVGRCSIGLLDAASALQNYDEALNHFRQSAQICISYNQKVDLLELVVHWAESLERQGDDEHALELITLALGHPSTPQFVCQEANQLRLALQAKLPPDVFQKAQSYGQKLTISEAVRGILGEGWLSDDF